MYSIVFQAVFNDDVIHPDFDRDLYHMFVTADSLLCAYERFKDIVTSLDSDFVYADIKVLSISSVSMR